MKYNSLPGLFFIIGLLIFMTANLGGSSISEIEVPLRGNALLEVESPLERVVLGDDELANIRVVSSTEILIFGRETGRTTVHLWTDRGHQRYLITVKDRIRPARGQISDLLEEQEDMDSMEFKAEHRDLDELVDYTEELLRDKGMVSFTDPETNKFIVHAPSELLDKLADLIESMDVPDAEDLHSERVSFEHRSAFELKDNVEEMLTGEGKVIADDETNSLLIVDRWQNLEQILTYLEQVDVEIEKQVRIEARFVEMTEAAEQEIGINWEMDGTLSGEDVGADFRRGDGVSGLELGLGAAAPGELAARMNLLEAEDLINLISSPRVVTRDNREASLEIINEQSYVSGWDVNYHEGDLQISPEIDSVDGGIELVVTPSIRSSDIIALDLLSEMSIVELERYEDPIGAGMEARPFFIHEIDRRTAELDVALKDGQTLVIGGLDREFEDRSGEEVPLLGRIPLLGPLFFGHRRDTSETRKLTIFLTAEIVELGPEDLEDEELPEGYEGFDELEDTSIIDPDNLSDTEL